MNAESEIYKKFKKELNITDFQQEDNPFVMACCKISKEQAIEFAEWIRTFEPLEKTDGFWVLDSQISETELFDLYLKDRDRWISEGKK